MKMTHACVNKKKKGQRKGTHCSTLEFVKRNRSVILFVVLLM